MTEAPTVSHVRTGVLDVPGAHLYYEVRGNGPLLLLVGAPMDASLFTPVADLLAPDFTVLTTDPRGINRSTLDDPETDSTAELRGADLAALIAHVGGGPAAAFGSSGGAVTLLALAHQYPEAVHTVVAHEPPINALLPAQAEHDAQVRDMVAAYAAGDRLGAWRMFMANAGMQLPEPVFEQMFGTPPQGQALADERYQFAHMFGPTTGYRPDVAALRDGPVRIVAAVGEQSAGQFCDRTTRSLAGQLGVGPEVFPGGHAGFMEDPAGFTARLRDVLGAA